MPLPPPSIIITKSPQYSSGHTSEGSPSCICHLGRVYDLHGGTRFLDAYLVISPIYHPVASRRHSPIDQENTREHSPHCEPRRHLEGIRFANIFLFAPPPSASFLPVHRVVPGEHSLRRRELLVRVRIAAVPGARIIPFEYRILYPTGSQMDESLQTRLGICPQSPHRSKSWSNRVENHKPWFSVARRSALRD